MATERRAAVRSSTRLTTPISAPPTAAKPVAARSRNTRSFSRDVEPDPDARKPTRRSARQASVTSIASESEPDAQPIPGTKRKGKAPEPVRDLATVEEVDILIDLDDAPQTPPRHQPEASAPFRSPGAASEMSGTTAISSFSMAESEFLKSKFIMRHLVKLDRSVQDFLDHLVPAGNQIKDDAQNIREMQKPDSTFNEEYRDFDDELSVHVNHFKSEQQDYILPGAVHRALFGADRDVAATQTGLDLILYLTNVLLFAKSFIHSNRHEKHIWDALRRLDDSFPTYFALELMEGANVTDSPTGQSALLKETFDLALDLRTQLAILVLQHESSDKDFDPDEAISEVFFGSLASEAPSSTATLRGWAIPALGGDDLILPEHFHERVTERLEKMRAFFPTDVESLERGDTVDLDGLGANYPWDATILRLLHWARLRYRELAASIDGQGGIQEIVSKVKKEIEQPSTGLIQDPPLPRASPRKKRISFMRDRRRSSRKFDPNAPVDKRLIEVLRAKERGINAQAEEESEEPSHQEQRTQTDLPALNDDYEPQLGDEPEEDEQPESNFGLPPSTAEHLKIFKEVTRTEKENRTISIFDRQADAKRVEFGDGFDESEEVPGPSTKGKGKQTARPVPRKRPLPFEQSEDEDAADDDNDDDDDVFETAERSTKAEERRRKAPVPKRVRIDPGSSSGAPPSHQPLVTTSGSLFIPELEESSPEPDALGMSALPPPSSYQATRQLSRQMVSTAPSQRRRKARAEWTAEAEEAFQEYMRRFPQEYSKILRLDAGPMGRGILQDRTQVNLKDKARNMAINMVKSGTGLKPGFENVITPKMQEQLIQNGHDVW